MIYTKQTYKIKAKKPYLFIGSKIRGMLGYALKDEVCINPSFKCDGCFAKGECVFYDMYEKQNTQHNYRLDFKLYDDEYKFSLLLFGKLQSKSKSIHKAMLNALKNYKKIKYKEKTKTLKIKKKRPKLIKLIFQTPLRMKKNNRFILKEREVDIKDILLSIYKIDLELKKEPYKPLNFNENLKTISKKFYYKELTRKSNKQNTKMNVGGLMGEMLVSGIDEESYKLLKLGEVLGCGKSRVFGLGKFKLEKIDV